MSSTTIQLSGRSFDVAAFTLGQLRKLLPALNRVSVALATDTVDEAAFDDLGVVLSAALKLPRDEVDALPMTIGEIAEALRVISQVSGLAQAAVPGQEGRPAGEPTPGPSPASTAGTPSTHG